MQPNSFESIFNLLKEKGLFSQYKDYADYSKKKTGEKLEKKVGEVKKEVDQFRQTLLPEEQKQYDMAFGLGDYQEKVQKRIKPKKDEKK